MPGQSPSGHSYWTDEDYSGGIRATIAKHINAGWKYVEGLLEKGQVKFRPTPLYRNKSGDIDFDPRRDAFAVRMGGTFVSDNRYHLGGRMYVDRNGMQLDPDECPECGGMPWFVKLPAPRGVAPWNWNQYTYCRRCVTPAEVVDAKRRAELYASKGGKR